MQIALPRPVEEIHGSRFFASLRLLDVRFVAYSRFAEIRDCALACAAIGRFVVLTLVTAIGLMRFASTGYPQEPVFMGEGIELFREDLFAHSQLNAIVVPASGTVRSHLVLQVVNVSKSSLSHANRN